MRINYRDLNNVSSLNSLSMDDLKNIWTPRLAFTNALGPFQTQVSNVLSINDVTKYLFNFKAPFKW